MESVGDEQFGARLSVVAQHRRFDIEVAQPFVRRDESPDQFVRLADLPNQFPALDTRLDRDEDDRRVRQIAMDDLDESLEVLEQRSGRFAGSDVIVAGVENDDLRATGDDDARRELDAVADLRAAKAPIDRRIVRSLS